MPTIDLGPCECCGGADCRCGESLPSSVYVSFSASLVSQSLTTSSGLTQSCIDGIAAFLSGTTRSYTLSWGGASLGYNFYSTSTNSHSVFVGTADQQCRLTALSIGLESSLSSCAAQYPGGQTGPEFGVSFASVAVPQQACSFWQGSSDLGPITSTTTNAVSIKDSPSGRFVTVGGSVTLSATVSLNPLP